MNWKTSLNRFLSRTKKISLATALVMGLTTVYSASGVVQDICPECEQPVVPVQMKPSFFRYGVSMIPHAQKREKGGEDAYYVSDTCLVVADGVGGWANQGIDSGLFSKQLVKSIGELYQQYPDQDLKAILIESVKRNTNIGSSTAVLLKLDQREPDLLYTCNLGDSGYLLFHAQEKQKTGESDKDSTLLDMYFRSQEQQYSFNFPYQCGTNSSPPDNAFDNKHRLLPNDVIVVGSDGLLDNLYEEDIMRCIIPYMKGTYLENPQLAAECMSHKSEEMGYKKNYLSPFAKHAQESNLRYMGGKPDDITVVVAQVEFSTKMDLDSSQKEKTIDS